MYEVNMDMGPALTTLIIPPKIESSFTHPHVIPFSVEQNTVYGLFLFQWKSLVTKMVWLHCSSINLAFVTQESHTLERHMGE